MFDIIKLLGSECVSNLQLCQSCAMPISYDPVKGSEKNGKRSNDYCIYCYQNGIFREDLSMERMIEKCLEFFDEYKKESGEEMTIDEARLDMLLFFPKLKRWKNDKGNCC